MSEKEMLDQLEDLIEDRRSFSSNNPDFDNPFKKDIDALKKIIHDYKILRDATYNSMTEKGENLCIWINENVKFRKAEIVYIWKTDFGDIRCNAILYRNKKPVANVIVSYGSEYFKNLCYNMFHTYKIPKFIENTFKTLIYDSFDKYLKLPKISKCSPLLKDIYDSVCNSEANMCHITEEDWEESYADNYNEKDIEILKQEIKKYKLESIIEFNEDEYKIIGYGDLQISFNDNRNLKRENTLER